MSPNRDSVSNHQYFTNRQTVPSHKNDLIIVNGPSLCNSVFRNNHSSSKVPKIDLTVSSLKNAGKNIRNQLTSKTTQNHSLDKDRVHQHSITLTHTPNLSSSKKQKSSIVYKKQSMLTRGGTMGSIQNRVIAQTSLNLYPNQMMMGQTLDFSTSPSHLLTERDSGINCPQDTSTNLVTAGAILKSLMTQEPRRPKQASSTMSTLTQNK